MRSGGVRGPWGCLRARCNERNYCRRARELPELAPPVSAPLSSACAFIDALLTVALCRRTSGVAPSAEKQQRSWSASAVGGRARLVGRSAALPRLPQRSDACWSGRANGANRRCLRAVGLLARTLQ